MVSSCSILFTDFGTLFVFVVGPLLPLSVIFFDFNGNFNGKMAKIVKMAKNHFSRSDSDSWGVFLGVLGATLCWKVVLQFWFGDPKCRFWYPQKWLKGSFWCWCRSRWLWWWGRHLAGTCEADAGRHCSGRHTSIHHPSTCRDEDDERSGDDDHDEEEWARFKRHLRSLLHDL